MLPSSHKLFKEMPGYRVVNNYLHGFQHQEQQTNGSVVLCLVRTAAFLNPNNRSQPLCICYLPSFNDT